MYQRIITYQQENQNVLSIRQLLKKWLIPKKWQHFLRIEKNVLLNGIYQPFNTKVKNQDIITLNFDFPPRTVDQVYLPGKRKLNVAYEDSDVLIVNKPANVKTHPNLDTESNTLFNDVQSYLSPNHPYMVHRIDMLTSGLVLISKSPYLVPIFNRELTTKILNRQYLAIVKLNQPMVSDGTIDAPIGIDNTDKRKRAVTPKGLDAVTDYQILDKNSNYAFIKLTLHTGRTHQIRVHLASRGWPIVNDTLYNCEPSTGDMCLCAYKMSYQVPFSDDFKTVQIPPTEYMKSFFSQKK